MSEKRFLNCLMVEGFMLFILGICILIIPKLTSLSYGVMLSGAFITYGIYKAINSVINRYSKLHISYGIIMGLFISTLGILILFVPKINLLWLVAFIGIYFIANSISSAVYSYYLRGGYNFWGCEIITSVILFIMGLSILLGIPVMSFYMVTVLTGIGMTLKGAAEISLSLININNYKV